MRRSRVVCLPTGPTLQAEIALLREGGWSLRVARRRLPDRSMAWLAVGIRGPILFAVSSDSETGAWGKAVVEAAARCEDFGRSIAL